MINKFILPLLAVLMLGSCSNKFSLVKRKYNKGYYLDMSKNNSHKAHETEKALVLKTKKAGSTSQTSETPELKVSTIKTMEIAEVVSSPVSTKKHAATTESKPLTASAKKNITQVVKVIKPVGASTASQPGKGSPDNNLIILIILCFLWWLNLIAVYLHDGKKITLNFWITLLLDFTLIGGIIFSLLVVLDIINLA